MKSTGVLLLVLSGGIGWPAAGQKLTANDVVAGHLAAIGTPEARAAVKTRFAQGKVQMRLMAGGVGTVDGRAFLFAEGRKFRAALPFSYADYWGEQFSSDEGKTNVGFSQPAQRSALGLFLERYPSILKEGFLGGVLSTSWPLLEREARQAKLDYNGLKNVDGHDLHQITYHVKKGQGEEVIRLFFEPETYRHVKSSYDATPTNQMVTKANESSKQMEVHYTVEEMFSDFALFDGLKLPTHWTIRTNVSGNRTTIREWGAVFDTIVQNEPIDPKSFVIDQTVK